MRNSNPQLKKGTKETGNWRPETGDRKFTFHGSMNNGEVGFYQGWNITNFR
jgi:hypothetical protein